MYSLGMTLTNLISSVPDGVLLLFSSYSMMDSLQENWKTCGVWNRLNSLKVGDFIPIGQQNSKGIQDKLFVCLKVNLSKLVSIIGLLASVCRASRKR